MAENNFLRGIFALMDLKNEKGKEPDIEAKIGDFYKELLEKFRNWIMANQTMLAAAKTEARNWIEGGGMKDTIEPKNTSYQKDDKALLVLVLEYCKTKKNITRNTRIGESDLVEIYFLYRFFGEGNEEGTEQFENYADAVLFHWTYFNRGKGRFKGEAMNVSCKYGKSNKPPRKRIRRILSLFLYLYLCRDLEKKKYSVFCEAAHLPYTPSEFQMPADVNDFFYSKDRFEETTVRKTIDHIRSSLTVNDEGKSLFLAFRRVLQSKDKKAKAMKEKLIENDFLASLSQCISSAEGIKVDIPSDIADQAISDARKKCMWNPAALSIDDFKDVITEILNNTEEAMIKSAKKDYFACEYGKKKNDRWWYIRDYLYSNSVFNEDHYELIPDIGNVYDAFLEQVRTVLIDVANNAKKAEDAPTVGDIIGMLSRISYRKLEIMCNDQSIGMLSLDARREYARKIVEDDLDDLTDKNRDWFDACLRYRLIEQVEGTGKQWYQFLTPFHRLCLTAVAFAEALSNRYIEKDFGRVFEKELSLFFDRYFAKATDQPEEKSDHLSYRHSEFAVFTIMTLLNLQTNQQCDAIEELCKRVREDIQASKRPKQKAYIVVLCNLLIQRRFQPTSKIRRSMMDAVYGTNIYQEEMKAFQVLLQRKDVFFANYPRQALTKAFDNCGTPSMPRYTPPFFIYLAPVLFSEEQQTFPQKWECDCYSLQYNTWIKKTNDYKGKELDEQIRIVRYLLSDNLQEDRTLPREVLEWWVSEDNISKERRYSEAERTEALCEKISQRQIRASIAFEMAAMGISNLLRAGKCLDMEWNFVVDAMVKSECIKRHYSKPYNDPTGEERLWLQSGGYRVSSAMVAKGIKIKEEDRVALDDRQAKVFHMSLVRELSSGDLRFFFLLARSLLNFSDFFTRDLCNNEAPEISVSCLLPVYNESVFLPYDHMDKASADEITQAWEVYLEKITDHKAKLCK